MGLIKLIILVILVLAVLTFWKRFKAWQADRNPPPVSPGSPQPMVRCAHCHLHLPRNLALQGPDQRWFCCSEHRDEQGNA